MVALLGLYLERLELPSQPLRAVHADGTAFEGAFGGWRGDCAERVYPPSEWPHYAVVEVTEARDHSCQADF